MSNLRWIMLLLAMWFVIFLLWLAMFPINVSGDDAKFRVDLASVVFHDNTVTFTVHGLDQLGNIEVDPIIAPSFGVKTSEKLVDGDILLCKVTPDLVCKRD